jgi:hypothetical protein
MTYYTEIKANFAIVLRGDILEIREVVAGLDILLRSHPDIKLVHQMTSASKLWIKEGGEMDEQNH